ncbi:MAG: mannose-1-phosphate guanylyltransferase [Fidelibacterota bacterium]
MKSPRFHAVIMAGGRGTRFWPLSRNSRPKQLLNIIGERSMLQMTVDRLRKIDFVKGTYIITGEDLADHVVDGIEGVPPEHVIVEPSGKNTAPCIGLAIHHIVKNDGASVVGVFPSDHLIVGHRIFARTLETARDLAQSQDVLVTIGITPSSPHTGYGYIQFDKRHELVEGRAYKVKTFAEKPTRSVAEKFLKSGDFLWNSGIFVWQASTYLEAMERHLPEHHEILGQIGGAIGSKEYEDTLESRWELLRPESVDYGILEKADNICVVKTSFEWSDVGSWNSYYELLTKNGEGNVLKGDVLVLDSRNNLIHSNGRMTAVVGLENVVVINVEDATLVARMDRVEDVKKIVTLLKKAGRQDLL